MYGKKTTASYLPLFNFGGPFLNEKSVWFHKICVEILDGLDQLELSKNANIFEKDDESRVGIFKSRIETQLHDSLPVSPIKELFKARNIRNSIIYKVNIFV